MISKQSGSVRAEGNEQRRLERKGVKASGKNGAYQSGARRSERSRAKRALNRERRAEQEERGVVRKAVERST